MAVIAVILVVAALKATQPISMPLAFAFFVVVLVHPLQNWLDRHLPHWFGLIVVLLLLAGVVGIMVAALLLSAELVEPHLPQYLDRLQQFADTAQAWAQARGFSVTQWLSSSSSSWDQVIQQAIGGIQTLLAALSSFIFIASLLVLLLLEVSQYQEKVRRAFPSRTSHRILEAVADTSEKLRRYLLVMTLTSILTGVLTGLWCFILGINLAFVWALIAFVLNYVPTLGSIIAVQHTELIYCSTTLPDKPDPMLCSYQ